LFLDGEGMTLDHERSVELSLFLAVNPGVDSTMQEYHVSKDWSDARKLCQSVTKTQHTVAIELLNAARALDLRALLQPRPKNQGC
jgi:histidine ammonia-lyase